MKRRNKERLASFIRRQLGIDVDPASLFDVQVKRMHETVIFGGKAGAGPGGNCCRQRLRSPLSALPMTAAGVPTRSSLSRPTWCRRRVARISLAHDGQSRFDQPSQQRGHAGHHRRCRHAHRGSECLDRGACRPRAIQEPRDGGAGRVESKR